MNIISINDFLHKLNTIIEGNVEISINQNKRTFISFNPKTRKLSLHKIFINAPKYILEALYSFIIKKKDFYYKKVLKHYINSCIETTQENFCFQKKVFIKKEGEFYDLDAIYKKLNTEYFDNVVNVDISWFGRDRKSRGCSRILGVFHRDLKLIQIHKCLDCSKVPLFFIEYVIYHEMLHYFFPITIDSRGRRIIHSSSFKERERYYSQYSPARLWEKNNKSLLFN